ncbi:hypothetical protein SAMN06265368_4425 [Cohaesibacter gelatinilyticus]|uniref:tRNA nuclease CdiA C-terminal domain-containing protein n=2 Tax=Cohaesibacter gelatinilyticus TaxID=372072 RepID=A0A285PIQ3_9HYPH|nr:hypothetical protein SAMN06265368_4425 [Cohaesibacter gelatinilyticus]
MMEDAQQQIGTGLEILPYQDRASIKPDGESDYWRAQQGQNKVLIRYQGQSLSKAPSKVQDWLADNAEAYGLFMPVGSTAAGETSPETRIADGFDTLLVASLDSPSSRALLPSAKQMEEGIVAIDNPDLQEAARANLQIQLDRQSKQDKAGQLHAARELWAAIDDGKSLDDVPINIRVAAGSATIAEATNFIRAREGGRIIQTDAVTLSELNRMMASNPDRFAGQDLDAYRNQISRNDLKELKQHQTDLLKQDSQALKRTELYKATFEQADQLLQQLGRSTAGPDGEIDPEAAKLNAQFLINLKNRIDQEFAKGSFDAAEPGLLQSLIQKQLAADFPDQAAELQALQDVSSSVSTNDSPTVWETIKTKSVDVVAGIVETFFERYEEDPEGFHNGLRLLDPFTEGMRATGLLEDESYKQIAQAFDDVSGEAITAVQPYLEDLIQKVERGEIDPNDTLVVAAGSLGAALLTASKKDRVRIIKATRSPFSRLIDAVKRKAQGPKTAPSANAQVDNGPAPNSKQAPGGATNKSSDDAPSFAVNSKKNGTGVKSGTFTGSYKNMSKQELSFVEKELAAGRSVERIPESKVKGKRSADFWISDGKTRIEVEFKSMKDVEFIGDLETDSAKISRGLSRKLTKGRGQSLNIAVDVIGQEGITIEIVERAWSRAKGDFRRRGVAAPSVRIIGKDFEFKKDWKLK